MNQDADGGSEMVVRLKRVRSSQYQTSNWICQSSRLAVYLRDGFTCLYCSADLSGADPRDITLDHVVSKKDGGTNQPSNIVTCCLSCNSRKKDTPLAIFTGPERVKMVRRNCVRKIARYRKLAKSLISPDTKWSDTIALAGGTV